MGCMSYKKGGFKGGFQKKAWGNWKKKWADKKCEPNDRDDRKDDFEKKIIKFDCGGEFKFKKYGWASDDGCNWKSKKAWKAWKRKDDDDGCGPKKDWKKKDWKKKDLDKKCDWKKIKPVECDPEEEEHPDTDGPVDQQVNRAPDIIAPTETQIMIDNTAQNSVVSKVEAVDLDGDSLVFKINDTSDADSPDADSFIIDPQTGEVTMIGVPSVFGSADGDWSYQIEVEVTDGQATDNVVLDMLYFASA